MKKYYFLFLLFNANMLFAQIPDGYYNTATGTGFTLKTQLYNIIKGHNDNGYSGLYVTYTTSDIDLYYEKNSTMLDMYTENPNGADLCEFTYGINQDNGTGGTSECEKYNREHIIPQSVFNSAYPMYSDAHFVVPSDKYVNAQRGNLPFGKVNISNWTSSNGSKRGSNLNSGYSAGYIGTVFEPIDEFKGDIARMYFYFATRYENLVSGWNYDMFNGTTNQVFAETFKNILLNWHQNDPVNQREIDRNEAVYKRQNNRNPFIDHPEWVNTIWNPSAGVEDEFLVSVNIYPNPVSTQITLQHSDKFQIKSYQIYTLLGQKVQESDSVNQNIDVQNLTNGIYILNINTENAVKSLKIIVEK